MKRSLFLIPLMLFSATTHAMLRTPLLRAIARPALRAHQVTRPLLRTFSSSPDHTQLTPEEQAAIDNACRGVSIYSEQQIKDLSSRIIVEESREGRPATCEAVMNQITRIGEKETLHLMNLLLAKPTGRKAIRKAHESVPDDLENFVPNSQACMLIARALAENREQLDRIEERIKKLNLELFELKHTKQS